MNGAVDERWSDAPDHFPPPSPLRTLDDAAAPSSPPRPPSPPPSLPPVEEPPKPNSPPPVTPNPGTPGAGGLPPSSTYDSSSSASYDDDAPSRKKQRPLSFFAPSSPAAPTTAEPPSAAPPVTVSSNKKPKKKGSSVRTKSTYRKGKKKGKAGNNSSHHHNQAVATAVEDTVLIAPVPRFPDKTDDYPDAKICLSKVYKAEKVELSEDRLTAGSTKGYRMVRATRGVLEGAWYFEIRIVRLGETGHTRLGWTTDKGDLQAPVGYDGNSYGYRDIDGVKVHKALREKYGEEGYSDGDVIGFYINLPDGAKYAPKPPHLVWYKGQRYVSLADPKDPPKVVPGSEISFFKNGVCQGVAFSNFFGGRYYPAASMYTLPNSPSCEVKFNFGPDFEFFPQDFGGRPAPLPMIEVPYHGYDGVKVEGPPENGTAENK